MSFSRKISSLSRGSTSPVIMPMRLPSIMVSSVRWCCSTSGRVGARKSTFPPFFCSTSAMTMAATTVFPSPVGRTSSVEEREARRASSTW